MTTPIKYRISSTATKPVSDSVKGAPLTSLEIDGNFRSIKDSIELIQSAYLPAGYNAPVEYVAGVILSSATQTVAYQGEVYAPKAAELPFTTSGTFEVTKFVQIQCVTSADLAATSGSSLVGYDAGTVQDVLDAVTGPTGAASVGYTPAGTGAVATTVEEKLRETVSFKDFGAVGNGAADDTAALLLMRDSLILSGANRHWHIRGAGGNYRYSNNKWLCGLRNVTIDLEGGSLTYTQSNTTTGDYTMLVGTASVSLAPANGSANAGNVTVPGMLISTINYGDTVVTFTNAGDAAKFTVGEPILLAGWDSQPTGYPPNYKVFEYNTVQAVDAGANTITVHPVANAFMSTWPDYTADGWTRGAARVFKLVDRAAIAPTSQYPSMLENIAIKNGTIAGTSSSHRFGINVAGTALFENLTLNVSCYGLSARSLIYRNCDSITGELEVDKIIQHVIIEGGSYAKLRGAASVQMMSVDSAKIHKDIDLYANRLNLKNVIAGPRSTNTPDVSTILRCDYVNIDNCALLSGSSNGGGAYLSTPVFTGSTYTPASISGSELTFSSYPGFAPGTILMRTDGEVYGRVYGFSMSAGNYVVTVRWSAAEVAVTGNAFYAFKAQKVEVSGYKARSAGLPGCMLDPYSGVLTLDSPRASIIIDRLIVYTKITSIEVNVIKAGTAGSVLLRGFGGVIAINVCLLLFFYLL